MKNFLFILREIKTLSVLRPWLMFNQSKCLSTHVAARSCRPRVIDFPMRGNMDGSKKVKVLKLKKFPAQFK